MTKNKILINFFIGIILIVILLFGVLIGVFLSKGTECKVDPLKYGVKMIEQKAKIDVICSCNGISQNTLPFYFDDEGVYDKNPYFTVDNLNYNLS